MSLDRPTRSIRLLQMDRTSEDRLWDKRRSSHATNSTKNLYRNLYLTLFGRKLLQYLFGLIQLIGSTRPKLDV